MRCRSGGGREEERETYTERRERDEKETGIYKVRDGKRNKYRQNTFHRINSLRSSDAIYHR